MPLLTKSRFLSGQQCAKRLWLEVHQPLSHASTESMPLVNGRAVDRLIQDLQRGPRVSREAGLVAAVDETRRIFSVGAPDVLHQGAFRAGPLAAIADVIRRTGDGFELVEVKASTAVKSGHLADIAFQALVLQRAQMPISRSYIAYVNKHFVLQRPGDYRGLVVEKDVTAPVREMLPVIAEEAARSVDVMDQPAVPDVPMGTHCEEPHSCPFVERCNLERASRPAFPLSILPRGGKVVAQLAAEGYEDLRTVPAESLTSADHRRIHAATLSGRAQFDAAPTHALRALAAPLAYLDFETMNFAVPEIVATKPYEQCPFQWSLHVEASDGTLEHADYLDVETFGDFETLAAQLLSALPTSGPVFVYNRALEAGVLERLALRLPALAPALNEVIGRLVDLWPITRAAYYRPAMLGSWSLKSVLPTLDPALAYDTLDEIQEGGAAQLAFLEIRNERTSDARRAELYHRLRSYCARDTYGMVVLRRFLCSD